ncbi:MAG: hypothetical protein FWG68_03965 [Defluviitaleaceae bacterium]|nr:hypothetical protein [Defluviitaleaceae bacterium]
MDFNPIQGQPQQQFYANPSAFLPVDRNHPNTRMERTQESSDIRDAMCQTCQNRRYVDRSDDSGVSFQAPTRISPSQAATAVFAHEREHYTREASRAEREGRQVVENTIRLFTAFCPECGAQYVSGGETRTVTRSAHESHHENNNDDEENPNGMDFSV